jgi:hypothetical protein
MRRSFDAALRVLDRQTFPRRKRMHARREERGGSRHLSLAAGIWPAPGLAKPDPCSPVASGPPFLSPQNAKPLALSET